MKANSSDLPQKIVHPTKHSIQLIIVYFAAISVSLGTAVSALGRIFLYGVAFYAAIQYFRTSKSAFRWSVERWQIIVFCTVAYMAVTSFWTSVTFAEAASSWLRHARLLSIPIVWLLIRNATEARLALRIFVLAQLFVVFSSLLLVFHIPVMWATARNAATTYAVFGSYLEQSISQSIAAFILWHQRDQIFGVNGKIIAMLAASVTLIHTFGFLAGRTGHVISIVLLSLAIIYELPRRFKWVAIAIPIIVILVVFLTFKTVRDRVAQVQQEIVLFSQKSNDDLSTSSGTRLTYWKISLEAIKEKPIFGSGVGSWNKEYRRLSDPTVTPESFSVSDPHQMFLLWAVESGGIGLFLLCAFIGSMLLKVRLLAPKDRQTMVAILLSLIVAGLFTSTVYGIGMGDYFCMAIGIMLAMTREKQLTK